MKSKQIRFIDDTYTVYCLFKMFISIITDIYFLFMYDCMRL